MICMSACKGTGKTNSSNADPKSTACLFMWRKCCRLLHIFPIIFNGEVKICNSFFFLQQNPQLWILNPLFFSLFKACSKIHSGKLATNLHDLLRICLCGIPCGLSTRKSTRKISNISVPCGHTLMLVHMAVFRRKYPADFTAVLDAD